MNIYIKIQENFVLLYICEISKLVNPFGGIDAIMCEIKLCPVWHWRNSAHLIIFIYKMLR